MIINQFLRFLKDNRVYDYYIIEFNKGDSYRWRSRYAFPSVHNAHNLHEFLKENLHCPNNFIFGAFSWSSSNKISYQSWYELSVKWQNEIYSLIKT